MTLYTIVFMLCKGIVPLCNEHLAYKVLRPKQYMTSMECKGLDATIHTFFDGDPRLTVAWRCVAHDRPV